MARQAPAISAPPGWNIAQYGTDEIGVSTLGRGVFLTRIPNCARLIPEELFFAFAEAMLNAQAAKADLPDGVIVACGSDLIPKPPTEPAGAAIRLKLTRDWSGCLNIQQWDNLGGLDVGVHELFVKTAKDVISKERTK